MTRAVGKMSVDGVVEIPEVIREAAGIHAGDEVIIEARGTELVLRKVPSIFDHNPPRPRHELGLTDRETTDIAWEDHIQEKFGTHTPDSQ